jgi:hypothetical protein
MRLEQKDLYIGCYYDLSNPMNGGTLDRCRFDNWTEALLFEAYGQPIPISSEILESSGFEYDDDCLQMSIGNVCIWLGLDGSVNISAGGGHEYFIREVGFVHELQNLIYSLTGEELEIKIP